MPRWRRPLSGGNVNEIAGRLGTPVDELDLEPVVFKLTNPDAGGTGQSLGDADAAIALYRCFLKLCALYPGMTIVPTESIDRVWHAHMLDTAKYRVDCERVLGRFLDHFPYAGLRGEADRAAWQENFTRTRWLFRKHFGVELGSDAAASVCVNHGDGSDCCVGWAHPADTEVRPRPNRREASFGPGQPGER
jgi:hypothetical protein